MTTCFEVTRLLSDASDRSLTRTEHRQLKRHFKICPACRRCSEQFRLLRRLVKNLQQTRIE